MRARSLVARTGATLLAAILFASACTCVIAIADDHARTHVVPVGACVEGTDVVLGGLTRAEARARIASEVEASLRRPVTVRIATETFVLDAGPLVRVDVEAMLDRAFAPAQATPLLGRVRSRVLARPLGTTVPLLVHVDESALRQRIEALAARVETTPTDAHWTVVDRQLHVIAERRGVIVDREASLEALTEALLRHERTASLAVRHVEPPVTARTIGHAILVRRADRRLFLYDGAAIERVYRVAVGAPGYGTPRGWWRIVRKRYMPTWSNPGSEWAKDMPRYIPPGPSNPLGTRALDLDAPGIRIHGTTKDSSIGPAASHG